MWRRDISGFDFIPLHYWSIHSITLGLHSITLLVFIRGIKHALCRYLGLMHEVAL